MLGQWLIRAEGVGFPSTLLDTQEIAIIRGASLALLKIDELLIAAIDDLRVQDARLGSVSTVYTGASQCLIRVTVNQEPVNFAEEVRKALSARQRDATAPPFRHLVIVCDAMPLARNEDLTETENRLYAMNRARQLHQWSVPPPGPLSDCNRTDPFDWRRPATTTSPYPTDKLGGGALTLSEADSIGKDSVQIAVSHATRDRRDYGMKARSGFYLTEAPGCKQILGSHDWAVTSSLSELIEEPPNNSVNGPGIPESAVSKIAVIYADGNNFTGIRRAVSSEGFSKQLQELRRQFLERLIEHYHTHSKGPDWQAFAVREKDKLNLRLETLLWGGDEFIFAVPSWLAFPIARLFFEVSQQWRIGNMPLCHAMGVVIANHKSPIRQLRECAQELADQAKDAGLRTDDSLSFEVFESVAPPDQTIKRVRAGQYGVSSEAQHCSLARRLAIPGNRLDEAMSLMSNMRRAGQVDGLAVLPRSQIYKILRLARAAGELAGNASEDSAREALEDYAVRVLDIQPEEIECSLPAFGNDRGVALSMALISQIWDYTGGVVR